MKYLINYMWVIAVVLLTACGDDESSVVVPSDRGTVADTDGNVYNWVRIGDLQWTTSNARNGTDMCDLQYFDGWDYVDAFSESKKEELRKDYIPVYGNLMSYEDALASAPEGWRLPSDEDWQALERMLGMADTDSKGWRGKDSAFKMMEETGGTELALRIGGICTWKAVYGWMELELDYVKEYGYYWTSTIDPSYTDHEAAYYRKLCFGRGSVERQCGTTDKLMNVRWVRDAR
ncbi:putative uncharacterized protein [Bacteroides sp. CAG:754]|jgi:uncharacterized protein (TIGR02145 family)|nr:FISUMP domain-containing protein [Bacteroides acidifaciens]CDA83810.1 putative uncharacterized protein [Bacteroides sp. CAG:754]